MVGSFFVLFFICLSVLYDVTGETGITDGERYLHQRQDNVHPFLARTFIHIRAIADAMFDELIRATLINGFDKQVQCSVIILWGCNKTKVYATYQKTSMKSCCCYETMCQLRTDGY